MRRRWANVIPGALGLAFIGMPGDLAAADQPASVEKPRPLPASTQTYPYRTAANPVTFRPGKPFSIDKPQNDFILRTFTISADGSLVALGWDSGRIEVIESSKPDAVRVFKSGRKPVHFMQFSSDFKTLLVTGDSGKIRFLDTTTGKRQRTLRIERGPRKYRIRTLAVGPGQSWLAYVNGENGKALDLTSSSPGVLAEFGDAADMSLSIDGSELWIVNRKVLARFDVATWKQNGEWPLPAPPIDKSEPSMTVGATESGQTLVAVPSKTGLIVYHEPEVAPTLFTDRPTDGAWFSRSSGLLLNLSLSLSLLRLDGSVACERSYKGRMGDFVTEDGKWLGLRWMNSVYVWRIEGLLRECDAPPSLPSNH